MHGGFKTQTVRDAIVQGGHIISEDGDAVALDAQYRHLVRSYLRGILTLDQYLVRVERLTAEVA